VSRLGFWRRCRGNLIDRGGLDRLAALPIDPRVRGDAKQVRARVFYLILADAEGAESAQKRFLNQIVSIPWIAGEAAAIALEGRPDGAEVSEILMPRAGRVFVNVAGQFGVAH
jgi:hypothetical protein